MSKYLLYGAGVSNLACAKFLVKRNIDFDFLLSVKEAAKEYLNQFQDKILYLGFLDLSLLRNYIVVRSPGIPHYDETLSYCYKNNIRVISEIELSLLFNNKGKYIAVTGSNGKTTVVSLIYHILKSYHPDTILAGNIGTPLIEFADNITDNTYVVLEISSFQIEDTYSLKPFIGTILNLTPNHLNHVESLEYYYNSKLKLVPMCEIFILNIDDEGIRSKVKTSNNMVTISLTDVNADIHYINDCINNYKITHPNLIGRHNKSNVLTSYTVCKLLGIEDEVIKNGIESFKGVEYRLEYLGKYKNLKIYNDAKSTTPESTLAALESFSDMVAINLLLGGQNKNLDFNKLKKSNVIYYAYGEAKDEIKKVIPEAMLFNDIRDAFYESLKAESGIILLSPACASFDQFSNFTERGKYFTSLVREVLDNENSKMV